MQTAEIGDQRLATRSAVTDAGSTDTSRDKLAGTRTITGSESNSGSNLPSASITAAGTAPTTSEVSPAQSFLFELVTAAFYHRARVTWFAGLHRVGMFLNILAGTAAVAVIKEYPPAAVILALILAFITAANLAFDFAGMARKHEDARRVYHELAAELEEGDDDDKTVKRLRARLIRSAATEPIVFEAAEKIAYNSAIRSLGRSVNDEFILTRWQRFVRHIWPYSGKTFPKRKDGTV